MRTLFFLVLLGIVGCKAERTPPEQPPRGANGGDIFRQPGRIPILLPKDAATVVLILDYHSAWEHNWMPRKTPDPYLAIYADGRLVATKPYDSDKKIENKISVEKLQELLQFCIYENKFFEIDGTKMEYPFKPWEKKIFDANTTRIRIKTADKEHEIRCYGLEYYAKLYPADQQIRQLHNVDRQLHQLWSEGRP